MVLPRPGLMLPGTQSTTTKSYNTPFGTAQTVSSISLTLNSCKLMKQLPIQLPPAPQPIQNTAEKIERLLTELELLTQQLRHENSNATINGIRPNTTDSRTRST
jgi:hypothetical protein